MKQTQWPCRIILAVSPRQEVTRVRIYDKATEVDTELAKLKPFTPVLRIPKSRTAEWKRGYYKALREL